MSGITRIIRNRLIQEKLLSETRCFCRFSSFLLYSWPLELYQTLMLRLRLTLTTLVNTMGIEGRAILTLGIQ